VHFEYIPRESNFFGDLAAGIASPALLKSLTEGTTPSDEDPTLPRNLSRPLLIAHESSLILTPTLDSLVLAEIPSVEPCIINLYLSRHEARDNSDVQVYLRTLMSASLPKGVSVTYHKRRGTRLYATKPAAQHLPSQVRLFLFGRDHVEVDLVASALQVFIFYTTGMLRFENRTASEWREEIYIQLRQCTSFYNHAEVKLLVNIFLNTSAENAIKQIKTDTFFLPPPSWTSSEN
jgi:hypothetical protein